MSSHEKYMKLALKEALLGVGKVSPNPLVGAVIVKNNKIIGKGAHLKHGENHAEINAILSVKENVKGSTLYVTLEPCSHYGNTPPCTKAIIDHQIKEVYVAILDPDERVSGKGVNELRKAGIDVKIGLCQKEAYSLNEKYFFFKQFKKPFILYKSAFSLDGAIATNTGESRWISSYKSRIDVHSLRNHYDAVMIGKGTLYADNPLLTVRDCIGRNPRRIIIAKKLELAKKYKIFTDEYRSQTIVITTDLTEVEVINYLKKQNITIIKVPIINNKTNLIIALDKLAKINITSILLEGGAVLATEFFKQKLINKVNFYISPQLIGSGKNFINNLNISNLDKSIKIDNLSLKVIDTDILLTGNVIYS